MPCSNRSLVRWCCGRPSAYTASMATDPTAPAAERLRAALRLHELGLAIKRQNLRRRHVQADESEIERLLGAWLADRPPDCPGRLIPWPRERRCKA